jgi:hypothetical protein
MISIETEARVAKLLMALAEGEKVVEIGRQQLGEELDFDAYQTFKRIDREAKNYIDEFNIVEFLKINSVYCSLNEARTIIFLYDADNDGYMNYTEFLNFVLSDTDITLRKLARERIGTRSGINLTYDIEICITKLIEKQLDLIRNIEYILNDLKSRHDYDVFELFSTFKPYSASYLSIEK